MEQWLQEFVFYFDESFEELTIILIYSASFMRLMLENKMIDIDKTDEEGLNAFWIAARCGHGEIMRVLAEHSINIYNTDRRGNNALHMSAKFENRFSICDLLVKS